MLGAQCLPVFTANPRLNHRYRYLLRLSGGAAGFRYWRILVIIIESGMIYSVALICEVTLYFLGLNSFYIVYDPIGQLTVRAPRLDIREASRSD